MVVNCELIREDLSARLDHEEPRLSDAVVAAHLQDCRQCPTWLRAAQELRELTGLLPAPDLTASILTAVRADQARRGARRTRSLSTRWALALLGVIQLAISGPVLLFGHDHTAPIHIAHEVGSFDAALAIGLLLAAIKPRLAAGMLPLVAAITALLLITAASDVATGRTLATSEAPHLLDLLGLLLMTRLATTSGGWSPPRITLPRSPAHGRS
jgi:predicted anti-sigma-YlaC factor YlaD